MFDKLYDFYIDNEELIIGSLLLLGVLVLTLWITCYFDKELTREKDIIENTKNYVIYDNCKKFNDKYYCWEEIYD